MKKIMIMNTNNIRVVLSMVVMLLTASAVGAVNYPTYKASREEMMYQSRTSRSYEDGYRTGYDVPSITPMLNADGTAVNPYQEVPSQGAARIGGPRRVSDNDAWQEGPAGDAVPVGAMPWLMIVLLAAGYAAATAYRRRRAA